MTRALATARELSNMLRLEPVLTGDLVPTRDLYDDEVSAFVDAANRVARSTID
jgi:hypothetical protein